MFWTNVFVFTIGLGFWIYWAIHDHPSYDEKERGKPLYSPGFESD
jgi:hypothetical protein